MKKEDAVERHPLLQVLCGCVPSIFQLGADEIAV